MTELQLRQKVVGAMQEWLGCKESDGSHKKIIDIYNAHKPLARSYKVKYTDAWCATSASAAAIVAGLTDIIPTECGCGQMIQLFMNMGRWQENDAYRPQPGDYVFYDWDDNGVGDDTGWPEHVGIVVSVSGNTIRVIEGNKNDAVGYRDIAVNGRYIRGYGVPNYASKATKEPEKPAGGELKVGDIVNFKGNKHYTSVNATSGKSCKPGKAKITAVYQPGKSKHPYHIIAEKNGGSTVYGWVDAGDIGAGASGNQTYGVGDEIQFSGNTQYTSSYNGAKAVSAKACKAKITAENKSGAHQYHIVGNGVYGWVNASDISK